MIEVLGGFPLSTKSWRCECQDGQAWMVTEDQSTIPHTPLCVEGTVGSKSDTPSTLKVVCPATYYGTKMHV